MEDERIIALFFERSELAIRALDDKYGALCRAVAFNILADAQDAEECVSDAYLGAWNAIPPARPNPLRAYIIKIVRNLSVKAYRSRRAAKRSGYTVALEELDECIADTKTVEDTVEAAETTDIGGVSVTFGHCLADYGPYDPDTHEPAGQYERYTAEFTLDGISYRITTDQLAQEEIVKIAASIIYGEAVTIK